MRILFVTPYYYPELKFGGPPLKMHALSRGLARGGHEVRVVCFHSDQPRAGRMELMDGVEVQYLQWIGRGRRQCPLSLRSLKAAVQWAEVIHIYGIYDLLGPAAAYFARRQKRPLVIEPLGMYVPRARNIWIKGIYHRIFTQRVADQAARVVAASEVERDELRSLASDHRLVVRRNGIDLADFQNLSGGPNFRARWGIAPAEQVILFLGRISPIKNLDRLVTAFGRAAIKDSRLVLAGPTTEADYVAKLKEQVASLKLAESVLFTGPLFDADKLAALAAADLFVLPSLSESFGNAAAEAVAAGVPVLLTRTCGIATMIDGRAGLAVGEDVDALVAGLRTMTDATQRKRLTSSFDAARNELSWEEPIKQTEALYREIVGETRPDQAATISETKRA